MTLKKRGLGSSKIKQKPVLLLNSDYTVLMPITLKRAINLYFMGKAKILKTNGNSKMHPLMDVCGKPVVVILTNYTKVPYKEVPITKRNVLIRDGYKCCYTGEPLNRLNASVDHIIPKSRKGSPGNTWENLVSCSKRINNQKADKTPEEIGLKLKIYPHKPTWSELIVKYRSDWKEFIEELNNGKFY